MWLIQLLYFVVVLFGLGTFTWIAWDQIAYSLHWPRPQWGAGVGLVYLAVLANFLCGNKITIGRTLVNSDGGDGTEVSQGGDSGRTKVWKDPPSDLTPMG